MQHNGKDADRKPSKHFDKKQYRLKKYSNKYKLDKWEQAKKKEVLKKFYKEVKNDPQMGNYTPFNFDENPDRTPAVENDKEDRPGRFVTHPDRMNNYKEKPFWKAKQELQRLNDEKAAKKEAHLKSKQEREQALRAYKEKKADKFKYLSKKTKSGQPLMKDRMAMLLDKIQKTV